MDEFAKKYGDSVFAFGMGYMLLNLTEIPTWAVWTVGLTISAMALISLLQFGNQVKFWGLVQQNPKFFGPKGDHHEGGLLMFDIASKLVGTYQTPGVFWFSLGTSVVLMAGLLVQEMYVVLALEFIASVIGYSFIKAFLKNYQTYYGILNVTVENV